MKIWLASYPRSGNTLLRLALQAMGYESRSIYEDKPIKGMFDDMHLHPDFDFVKTHARERDESKAICVIRDGRDALVSLAHYTVDIVGTDRTFPETLDLLIDGEYKPGGGATWNEHVDFWVHRDHVLIILFENMLKDLTHEMRRAARFCGIIEPNKVNVDFETFKASNPKFFRRGIVGSWKDEMTDEQHKRFWKLQGDSMRLMGYNRKGE